MENNKVKKSKTRIILNLLTDKVRLFFLRPYWRDKVVLMVLSFSLALNISLWIFLKVFIKPGSIPLTLHYTIHFGPDLLGEAWQVLTIPLVGVVVILINLFLGFLIYFRDKFSAYFLLSILPVVQVFLWIAGISVVLINL